MLQDIKKIMDDFKPDCAEITKIQNARYLKRIYEALYPDDETFDLFKLQAEDINTIIELISKNTPSVSKNLACACNAIMRDPKFTEIINQVNEDYQTRVRAHIPSQRDLDGRISTEEIEAANDRLKAEFDRVYEHTKSKYTPRELQAIRNYVLFQVVSGRHFAPRRSLDWCAMKIFNIDEEKDNFVRDGCFVFNSYKTCKTYGKQLIPISNNIYDLILILSHVSPHEYMFATNNGHRFFQSNFNTLINELMGCTKGKSTNSFRKFYLQNKFGNVMDIDKTMAAMGSSSNVINSYITRI